MGSERPSCAHKTVYYRPTGGNAIGWTPRWVCEHCGTEFAPLAEGKRLGAEEAMRSVRDRVSDFSGYDAHMTDGEFRSWLWAKVQLADYCSESECELRARTTPGHGEESE